jgi:hypothetical protein
MIQERPAGSRNETSCDVVIQKQGIASEIHNSYYAARCATAASSTMLIYKWTVPLVTKGRPLK